MKKIFFCDIDGTIVDSIRGIDKPSDKTIYAFKELSKDNIVFLASGRMKCLLDKKIQELSFDGYLLGNGAYANYKDDIIVNKTFSIEDTEKVIDYCNKNNGAYFIQYLDYIYTKDKDNDNYKWLYEGWTPVKEANVIEGTYENEPCAMICVFENGELINDMKERFKDFMEIVPHGTGRSLDIIVKGVSKGSAIKDVLNYFKIDKDNAYAFGDGNNDVEMFDEVGHSIAMGNASDYVKSFAKEVTDTVDNDGFYNYLINNKIIKPMD